MCPDLVPASDGQLARLVRSWSRDKHYYVDRYLNIFCNAMKDHWDALVYADLLSGPRRCIEIEQGRSLESEGTPLLALRHAEFTRLFLNDFDSQVTRALAARAGNESHSRVQIQTMDCNEAVPAARRFLFPPGSAARTLGLAVIDPTAFQMKFNALAELTSGVRLDLIIIVMTGFILRFIRRPQYADTMDDFIGTNEWRSFGPRRRSRQALDLYEKQLGKLGYLFIHDQVSIHNSNGSLIYHIVYASRHQLGAQFFRNISQITHDGQRRLFQ